MGLSVNGRGLTGAMAILLPFALWSMPAIAQQGWDNPPGADQAAKPKLQLNPYEQAMRFKEQGNCAKAIELLEPQAKLGRGYEVAQFNLGQCYVAVGETRQDAEQKRKDRAQGVQWIVRAADAGLASAQAELVKLTLQGGWVKIEPAEAGKWYLLWKRNPRRSQLGVSELDPRLQQQLKTMLSDADWAEANTRADAWQVMVEPGQGPVP
jgi:hypothetical protein